MDICRVQIPHPQLLMYKKWDNVDFFNCYWIFLYRYHFCSHFSYVLWTRKLGYNLFQVTLRCVGFPCYFNIWVYNALCMFSSYLQVTVHLVHNIISTSRYTLLENFCSDVLWIQIWIWSSPKTLMNKKHKS